MEEFSAYNVALTDSSLGKKALSFLDDTSSVTGGSVACVADMTFSFYLKPDSLSQSGRIVNVANNYLINQEDDDLIFICYTTTGTTQTYTFTSAISEEEKAYSLKLNSTSVDLYKSGSLFQSQSLSSPKRLVSGAITFGNDGITTSFVGNVSSYKIYSDDLDDNYIMSDAYFPEPLQRTFILYYIPLTKSSSNLVMTSLGASTTSTIHALETTDYLYWTDYGTINETTQNKVLVSSMESGYEVRRSVWNNPLKSWSFIPYHKLFSTAYEIMTFYESKNGNEQSFGWRCPLDGYVYKVRFDNENLQGTAKYGETYDINIAFQEVR